MDDKFPVWNINNNEFTLDLQDLNDVEKYTNACDVLSKQEKSFDKNVKYRLRLTVKCIMIFLTHCLEKARVKRFLRAV